MLSFAKAIYGNEAESNDELSFERDDVMTVLEKDFNGLDGWWFCSLRGKTGIAPANRLQIIREIKEKPLFAKVRKGNPGNATGSGIHGQTDYDIPKPNVPRKLGGSCEDLLSIEFVSYDPEADRAPRTSLPGGRLPSGGRGLDHGAGGKGRCRMGGSCDDVLALSTENLSLSNASSGIDVGREYDVPVSLSPEVYVDLPAGSGRSKRKSDRAAGKAVTGSAQRADADARWQQKQSSNRSDKQTASYGRHQQVAPQTKTTDHSFGRDSALADYDVPTSSKNRIKNDSAETPRSDARNLAERGATKASDSVETKTRPPAAAAAAAIVCDQSFLDSVRELQKAVGQVIDYSDRWQACRNWETRKSIVKQACLSVWNKLQALLADFSRLLVRSTKGTGPLRDRYGALKVSSANLEEILGHVERCRPNEVTLDFVNELSVTAQDIRMHIDYCVSVLGVDSGDISHGPGRAVPPPQNLPPPPQQQQQQQTHRRSPLHAPSPSSQNPKIVLERCESGGDNNNYSLVNQVDLNSKSSTLSGKSKTPPPASQQRFLRSFSHDNGLVDYDFPRQEGDRSGGDRGSRLRRESRPPSDEFTRAKRSAVAFGEKRESFSILERRSPSSPIMPSKLIVAGKTSPNIAQSPAASSSPRLNSSGTAEYDFPKPTAAEPQPETSHRTPSTSGGFPLPSSSPSPSPFSAGDKRTIDFYAVQMTAELERLDATCRMTRETLLKTVANRQVAHNNDAADFEALALAGRKFVFMCDAIVKNIVNTALKRKLRENSGAIVGATKAISKSLASAAGASHPPFSRNAYVQRIDEVMNAALEIGELLSLGTPTTSRTVTK